MVSTLIEDGISGQDSATNDMMIFFVIVEGKKILPVH
jgi:hypothetical protein